jgi:cytochrome c peroxidase
MRKLILIAAALIMLGMALLSGWLAAQPLAWSPAELATLRSLALSALPPLPSDPSNVVADNPRAVALGRQLFFDPRFSANGQVSCATCHVPGRYFTDGKLLGQGVGIAGRHTMSLIGSAYSPWFNWDGKADSQWAQAFGPLENAAEHGGDRMTHARVFAGNYAGEYTALFGPLPDLSDSSRFPPQASPSGTGAQQAAWQQLAPADRTAVTRVVVNMAKSLAAYQRTLLPQRARFDRYVNSLGQDGKLAPGTASGTTAHDSSLSSDEIAGLRLFIGKAHCINCHNGPLFTNFEFHNTAVPGRPGVPLDHGRRDGVAMLKTSEFNCLGPFSDAAPAECGETRFLKIGDTFDGSFRTPTLRNVAETAPYMHAGQFATLAEALQHYNQGGYALLGHNELTPLNLSEQEVAQLEAFLRTLTGPVPSAD